MENHAVPNDTQQWLILAAIVQIVCSALVAIVSLIVNKKVDETKSEVETNTKITKQVSEKADDAAFTAKDAAVKAHKAHVVGIENLKLNRENAGKMKEAERKIEKLEGDSGMINRESHIKGDNGDKA
jgi:hypothetical protein